LKKIRDLASFESLRCGFTSDMIYAFLAASAIAFAPPASLFQASPAVRFATPVMQLTRGGAPLLEEACTMGGGRPQGTFVRQSNGVVVPTTHASASAMTPMLDKVGMLQEACTMGGGRVQGTLVRQSNGVVVPEAASAPATAPTAPTASTASTAEILPEACTMGGGRPSGTPALGSYKSGSAVTLAQRL